MPAQRGITLTELDVGTGHIIHHTIVEVIFYLVFYTTNVTEVVESVFQVFSRHVGRTFH